MNRYQFFQLSKEDQEALKRMIIRVPCACGALVVSKTYVCFETKVVCEECRKKNKKK